MGGLPVALFPFVLLAQPAAEPAGISQELLLLSRASLRMADSLRRMPNYTCLETIERSQRTARRRKYELIDVLRLEVGLVDGRELFAWPGSGKFEEQELVDLVPAGGAIGNGSFAAHATSIFRSRVASIRFVSREANLFRYDFRVPQNLSGYKLRSGRKAEAIIGYHGSFFVDEPTQRVTRIEVVGDDIPISVEVLGTEASIDYGMVRIGEQDYWLPVASTMKIVSLDSTEFRNEIQFTGCRQFAGESVLSFDEAPVDEAPALPAAGTESVSMPKDKMLLVDLAVPVRWGASRTGDTIEAVLASSLKHRGAVVFPKGAKITGRIARLQNAGNGQILELVFDSIEDGGRRAPFRARLAEKSPSENFGPLRPGTRNDKRVQGVPDRPGVLVVMTYNSKLDLMKGFRTTWTTID